MSLYNLAITAYTQGDHETALIYFQQSLNALERLAKQLGGEGLEFWEQYLSET